MKTGVERTYDPMPSWRRRIEVYTSTDSWENLIDILNKKKDERKTKW